MTLFSRCYDSEFRCPCFLWPCIPMASAAPFRMLHALTHRGVIPSPTRSQPIPTPFWPTPPAEGGFGGVRGGLGPPIWGSRIIKSALEPKKSRLRRGNIIFDVSRAPDGALNQNFYFLLIGGSMWIGQGRVREGRDSEQGGIKSRIYPDRVFGRRQTAQVA